jgi:signal transduction histidine kinase
MDLSLPSFYPQIESAMTKESEQQLNHALDKVYELGFGLVPDTELEQYFAEKLLVIGTAKGETFSTREEVRSLIQRQKEQTKGIDLSYERKKVYRDFPAAENVAVIVEDIATTIKINEDSLYFDMRATAIFEFQEGRWMLIHWHVSKPEIVDSEKDTFGIEEWRQKTERLEKVIAERTAELKIKNEMLEKTMENLKSTQIQLIHSEKMASLGELTAGIAHEIKNPLNFVTNFSELSRELIEELKSSSSREEQQDILMDIDANLDKIHFHGKRADNIVKSMLQHSRASAGQKEDTDINELAEEYLRLSYHGLRAKEKSFNATLQTDFDPAIGLISIIPQDIGRVIMNLLTNAFYAVKEKQESQPEGYEPTVWLQTMKRGDELVINIKDNGHGIPETIREKIFQPFFTTKPTGQGTGLGLSMSYDIVQKGHGGSLTVTSSPGKETIFTITLPLNKPVTT